MKIRVGIIGTGAITQKRHAPEYDNNPNVEIVAFYGFHSDNADKLAKQYNAKSVKDYMEIINDPTIDAISDCSTNEMHHIITSRALRSGKHVLCEKPMALNISDAEDMIKAWEESGKILMIDYNQRLNRAHQEARKIIKSGELGKVLSFSTCFGHKGPEYWSSNKSKATWFFDKNRSNLGVIGDLGIHKIDLIRYLLDDEIIDVKSFSDTLDKKDENGKFVEVPDNLVAILKTAKGALGTAAFSWTYYGREDNSTKIYCEKGIIKLFDKLDYSLIVEKQNGEEVHYKMDQMQTNDNQTSTGIIDEFINSIIEKRSPIATGYDGIKAMRIVELMNP